MKRFFFLISLCAIFFVSCQDEESTDPKPVNPNAQTVLKSEYRTLLAKYVAESADFTETLKIYHLKHLTTPTSCRQI